MITCTKELESIVREALTHSRFEIRETTYLEKEMRLFIVDLDEKQEYKLVVAHV